ncbi:MAG: M55 family metallopeptidase [Pseudomonadota bacterium]
MHIYISADIEGVAGVVSPAQTLQQGFEYARARRWMTDEVRAACEGAFAGGASAITVSDSHGNGQNLLLEELPDKVRIVRNWPRPLGMMQGVERAETAAALLIGYHSGAQHAHGVLAHTGSGRLIKTIYLNGQSASETDLNIALAYHYGVPVVMASGDDVFCQHARESIGDGVVTVECKVATGRYSADTLTPAESCARIRAAAEQAVASLPMTAPPPPAAPLNLVVEFQRHLPAELLDYLPGFQREGATGIAIELPDMLSVTRVLGFITAVQFDEQIP